MFGIAESPDGSKLAVSDQTAAIYVLNPDNPAGAVRYPTVANGMAQLPNGLAVTNAGVVYYAFQYTASASIYVVRSHVILNPDGTRVYGDGVALVGKLDSASGSISVVKTTYGQFWLDTGSGQIHPGSASFNLNGFSNLCMSGDGSTLSVNIYFTDPSLNPETASIYSLGTGGLGRALNQDGSLAFQQLIGGELDVIARNSGNVLYTVQLGTQMSPGSVSAIYDPLLIANGQNNVGIITQGGVTFVDLSSLPVPSQDMTAFPDAVRSGLETPRDAKEVLPPTVILDPAARDRMRPRLGRSDIRMQ